MYFIIKDMQPLDTIDDKGFRHMFQTFEPRYTLPSRKTISTKQLPELYESEVARVKSITQTANSFALTTDIWTSRTNYAHIGATMHSSRSLLSSITICLKQESFLLVIQVPILQMKWNVS